MLLSRRMSWFGRKKPEMSPGGSVIERHSAKGFMKPRLGFPSERTDGSIKAREEVYGRLFGEAGEVSHELVPQVPHIDVYTYYRRAKDGSRTCVLMTGGMSDVPMRLPRGADAPRRVELILYCTDPEPEYIETMRFLAHFPHNQKTWLGTGHTIPNGNPPGLLWGSKALDTILLLQTVVKRDAELPQQLILDGDPVEFLWVVPISTPECSLKLEKGAGAILHLFDEKRHPHVFDPHRASYV
jgi:Suppressor of fused protein (SUFU)